MLLVTLSTLSAFAGPTRALTNTMHDRYEALTRARDAVISGQLDTGQAAARELAAYEVPEGLPAGWLGFVAQVDMQAVLIEASTDLPTAANAVADTAVACAGCHLSSGEGPDLRKAKSVPPQSWTPGSNMQLHAWSMGWMWAGLIAGNDAAWERGALELARQPVDAMFDDAPVDGLRELEQLVYVSATRALEVHAPNERAELYGAMLGVCAQCHVTQRPPLR